MFILAADIGGTYARFRLLETNPHGWNIHYEADWPSRDFTSLGEAVACCLSQLSRTERADIASAWLAVAGPVQGRCVSFTNLPWNADADTLCAELRLPRVHLVNDLEALAYAIPTLRPHQLLNIQQGIPGSGPGVVIATGTGLGVAALDRREQGCHTFPSEGGHSDFAATTDEQLELLHYLQKQYPHVSYERVLSGAGLTTLYQFRRQLTGIDDRHEAAAPAPARLMESAEHGTDPEALSAITLFTEVLGAFAGNTALQWLATGGVYLAGGVAIQLHPYITGAPFINAFQGKGRMHKLMTRIPVAVITDHQAGLEGITLMAANRSQEAPA